MEDGWRQNSPSKVNQAFGKASYRGDKLDLNLSTLLVKTELVGNGLLPSEMYAQDPTSIFTAPDTTDNTLAQFQFSGAFQVNDNFSVTGQVYRRNSKRHQVGADVMTDYSDELVAKRLATDADQYTCLYKSTNQYGMPDYVAIPVPDYKNTGNSSNAIAGLQTTQFYQDFNNGTLDINNYLSLINSEPLPAEFLASLQYRFEENRNFREKVSYNRAKNPPPMSGPIDTDPDFHGEMSYVSNFSGAFISFPTGVGGVVYDDENYFFKRNSDNTITKYHVMLLSPINEAECATTQGTTFDLSDPVNFNYILVDGAALNQPGYVQGTPTAVITDNRIDQIINGASLQLNWNLEHHKFMVGASVDAASAEYTNEQRLGFLDVNRNAYLDPAQAHPQFAAAFVPLANNNFSGMNVTQSLYFSETWSPVDALHLSVSGRYNQTHGKNKIAARSGLFAYSIGDLIADPDKYNICTDVNGDGTVDATDCAAVPKNFRPLRLTSVLDPAETEKFSYYSFNPSVGATWQANPALNLFANWAKGTRTPSVIELGCAFDKTPTFIGGDPNDPRNYWPKSLYENRQCTLPTTLSGDPYLPQIKATTYDIGMRGSLGESAQWNLGAYKTDLQNDIYFVAVGNAQGFFDNVGKTMRRGIEAGLSGKKDKLGFSLNYALTDATFQDEFLMISQDNSSSFEMDGYGRVIRVKPGSRMPGVPLHNLNASVSYDVTDKWTVGLSAVMHSESFVRGNENNEHQTGVVQYRTLADPVLGTIQVPRVQTSNPGSVPGYTVFNFQTSYKINKEWTATMLVNNLFDKEYFSAGRLGRNPFSPSIHGAIGPDGYNHNSNDWLSTNFISPGAPRGIWATLRYEFSPDGK